MTARTHDLAAFTGLVMALVYFDPIDTTIATVVAVLVANMLGGLAPDLDEPTTEFWQKLRGGEFLGRLFAPLFPGHRWLSHSLLGVILAGFLVQKLLELMSGVVLVDMEIVWWAFMIGYVSHLLMDMLTKDGLPLMFPISIRFGIPPIRRLRITTGKFMEKAVVFPGLILFCAYLVYENYAKFVDFFKLLN